jgi:hypothetical protein
MFGLLNYSRQARFGTRRRNPALTLEFLESRHLLAASLSSLTAVPAGALAIHAHSAAGNVVSEPVAVLSDNNSSAPAGKAQLDMANFGFSDLPLAGQNLTIVDFDAIQDEAPATWLFQGQVTGGDGSPVVITFGGLDSLEGQTANVDENGWFHLPIILQSGECGTATAQATDSQGHVSDLALTPVCLTDGEARHPRTMPPTLAVIDMLTAKDAAVFSLTHETSTAAATNEVASVSPPAPFLAQALPRWHSQEGTGRHSTIETEPLLQWSVGLKPPQPLELN